jgi:hypothetical protein
MLYQVQVSITLGDVTVQDTLDVHGLELQFRKCTGQRFRIEIQKVKHLLTVLYRPTKCSSKTTKIASRAVDHTSKCLRRGVGNVVRPDSTRSRFPPHNRPRFKLPTRRYARISPSLLTGPVTKPPCAQPGHPSADKKTPVPRSNHRPW